jgi:hypothetical protein
LHNAHRDLYKKEGPFGAKPVQMAFELLFLRPPSVRSWAKTLGLRSWSLKQALAYLCSLTPRVFDISALTFFPWETVTGQPAPPMQTFSRPPGFMGPPIATDYPAYDRRVTDAANDTDEETRRALYFGPDCSGYGISWRCRAWGERDRLEQERQRLQNELETLRRGLTVDSL